MTNITMLTNPEISTTTECTKRFFEKNLDTDNVYFVAKKDDKLIFIRIDGEMLETTTATIENVCNTIYITTKNSKMQFNPTNFSSLYESYVGNTPEIHKLQDCIKCYNRYQKIVDDEILLSLLKDITVIQDGENIEFVRTFVHPAGSDDLCVHTYDRKWVFPLNKLLDYNNNLEVYVDLIEVIKGGDARYYFECYQKGKYGGRNVEEYKYMHTLPEDRRCIRLLMKYIKDNINL